MIGCYEGGVFTAPIDTLQFTSVTGSSASDVTGTAYDPIEDKLYWVEYDYNRIARCNTDGSEIETFLASGVSGMLKLGNLMKVGNVTSKINNCKNTNYDYSNIA